MTPPSAAEAGIPSPCVRVCQLDEATRWCYGCFRNLNEIARWGRMSETEKAETLERIRERKELMGVDDAGPAA